MRVYKGERKVLYWQSCGKVRCFSCFAYLSPLERAVFLDSVVFFGIVVLLAYLSQRLGGLVLPLSALRAEELIACRVFVGVSHASDTAPVVPSRVV